MTEVVFLTSNQEEQNERVRSVSEKLKQRFPDVVVRILDGASQPDLMAKHKLKFGPAVLIDGLLEYVGIPRFSMLLDRVLQVREGRPNPRTAGERPTATTKPSPTVPAPPPTTAPR